MKYGIADTCQPYRALQYTIRRKKYVFAFWYFYVIFFFYKLTKGTISSFQMIIALHSKIKIKMYHLGYIIFESVFLNTK